MTYNTLVAIANDTDLRARTTACAAQEDIHNPNEWVADRWWEICAASTEWEASYAYALGTNNTRPGYDEGVISDAAILAVVQPLVLANP